jgi:Raf kinase inhibitor-like YbhB/YbcL family protein
MRMTSAILTLALATLVLLGCAKAPQPAAPQPTTIQKDNQMGFKLTSTSFKEGQPIPRQHTCDGVNVSPALEWSGAPQGAKTFAIICDDPDAPSGTWVHWVLYNLPADRIGLVENVPTTEKVPGDGLQGTNDFRKIGYGGPCPPSGTHHYFFKLYALDAELPLKPGATKAEVLKAMEGHTLAQTQLMGTYKR